MSRGGAVTKALDQKVYNLIFKLLDDQSAENKKNSAGDESKWFLDIALARDLRTNDVLTYLVKQDLLLQRMKRSILEESIDVILKELRKDEEVELAEAIRLRDEYELQNAAQVDSDFDTDPNNLMTVKDTNELNKSVILLWNKETEKTESDAEEKKNKKRSRDSAKPAPKQKKSKIDSTPPTTTLLSLGGLSAVTTQLMELVGLPILHPEIYQSTGVDHPRGILLYGPPGCGKTTIANALAGELKVPFINFSAPSVVSGMSGESEKKLREIFEDARAVAPCLIFIDEIDAITPKRDGGAQREMERRIVAQLLTLMDELTLENTDGKPVIVMGATNRPDSLDLALRRAGRFDREICLNVPDEEQRCAILKTMTSKLKLDDSHFNFRELAKLTPGFVGADLKSLVTAAGVAAIKRIFESLSEIDDELTTKNDAVDMDVDSNNVNKLALVPSTLANMNFDKKSEDQQLSTIQKFLMKHPNPLSEEQLAPLSISFSDFKEALPKIQPTAKREGFATIPDVTWKNVGALNNIRMELHMCIVQPIKKPELYQKVGISAPAGVLMWGPPGCGKTLLAKAVANESRANFISVKGPELLNKYVGESERAVRQVFQRARASVPCIIFFDELDALVPRRNSTLSESSARVVNTLLTELDGLNDRKGIFVVGATNRPDMIDPAMLRPGRLDKTLYIELPTAEERLDILKTLVSANTTPLGSDIDLEAIANDTRCRNFSGADLSLLVREAGVFALKKKFFHGQKIQELDESGYYEGGESDDNIVVTKSDFDGALLSIKPSVTDKDRARYDRLSLRMGWGVIQEEEKKEEGEEKN